MSLPANQQNQATAKYLPACESVGQSPLVQFKSSLLRPMCFAETLNEDYFMLGTFVCLLGHAPTKTIPKASTQGWTPSYQLIGTGSGQKSSSPSLWQICYHKGRCHRTIGLQFTPTHCERANQHPLARLQDIPALAGTTTKPYAKSKQGPTLIAPQAQTLHYPASPRSELAGSFKLDSLGTAVLCLLNTPDLVSSLSHLQ
jgi:hypothetical protein